MNLFKNTIILLRFPFSLFLLPITLFSFFYIKPECNLQLFLVLIIWHVLVFPASNGYNSYHDQDDGPIGGLANPPKPTKLLFYLINCLDAMAIILACFVKLDFAVFVFVYILISRLYSNRAVRLKKYPIVGFLVVFIFQGAWVFCGNFVAFSSMLLFSNTSVILSAIASSFFIGTIYPLTQIYQHHTDEQDNVKTLSMLLGKKQTFIFSAFLFLIANVLLYISFHHDNLMGNFWLFNLIMLPSTVFFFIWAIKSFINPVHINFKNTMIMLILSSCLNNIYFILLLFK